MDLVQLESKLSSFPRSPLSVRLASEYLSLGRIDQAKELCRAGLEEHPSYPTAHLILARCFQAEKDYISALLHLHQTLHYNPDAQTLKALRADWENFALQQLRRNESSPTDPFEDVETLHEVIEETEHKTFEAKTIPSTEQEITQDAPEESVEGLETISLTEPKIAADTDQEGIEAEITPSTIEEIAQDSSEKTAEDFAIAYPTEPEIVDTTELETSVASVQELEQDSSEILHASSETIAPTEPELASPVDVTTVSAPVQEISQHSLETPGENVENLSLDEPVIGSVSETSTTPPQEPQPHYDQSVDLSDDSRIVSKTLAEIYAMQGAYNEAILTYQLLKHQQPHNADEYDQRIQELQLKLQSKPLQEDQK
ncbi:MAG: tetratricopeptide repeat protein [Ignavibacteriae bacterium]|nr:tetratricopeptide repeat protein [Ignavibacteriota bacterium]